MTRYEQMQRAFELDLRMAHFRPALPQFIGGIYRIRNLATDECYIGSTFNLRSRRSFHQHKLVYGKHTGLLQAAFDKHGPELFAFEVLIICEREWLSEYEWALIDRLNPAYNYHK